MRALLLEHEPGPGLAATAELTQRGLVVNWVQSGAAFNSALVQHRYDVLLLGLRLVDAEGVVMLEALRRRGDNTPVIVIAPRWQRETIVNFLDLGADDILVKPYDTQELLARTRAVLRRAIAKDQTITALTHGPLVLNVEARLAQWHGESVALTMKEFWLLEALMRQRSRVLSRSQIEDSLYGCSDETGSNTVEVYIHRLRKKFSSKLIVTLRGLGYQLGQLSAIGA